MHRIALKETTEVYKMQQYYKIKYKCIQHNNTFFSQLLNCSFGYSFSTVNDSVQIIWWHLLGIYLISWTRQLNDSETGNTSWFHFVTFLLKMCHDFFKFYKPIIVKLIKMHYLVCDVCFLTYFSHVAGSELRYKLNMCP